MIYDEVIPMILKDPIPLLECFLVLKRILIVSLELLPLNDIIESVWRESYLFGCLF